jgi:hypothetical protein
MWGGNKARQEYIYIKFVSQVNELYILLQGLIFVLGALLHYNSTLRKVKGEVVPVFI